MENLVRLEHYLRDVIPENPDSVLDVGTDHSGIFDFEEWEKRDLKKKTCVCMRTIRKNIPDSWRNIIYNGTSLPFNDNEYDVVQCCRLIEHVSPDKWDKFVNELCRVSKDLVFITTNNNNRRTGSKREYYKQEEYIKFLKNRGFHILFESSYNSIVFKRKIPTWDAIFYDMDYYVKRFTALGNIESVIDIGTGNKGVVAQDYYENGVHIKQGYACDIWVLKELSSVWKPLKMNALDLLKVLGPKSVDVVQAFGFLEHLNKSDGYKFLDIAEKIAKKAIIISAAAFVHGPTYDYKAKKDGNPYHYYNSTWHWKEFEKLGYRSNYEDMRKGLSFSEEAIAWKILGI